MNRRRRWIGYVVVGVLMLIVGTVIVLERVDQYRSTVHSAFRTSCRRQAATLESFAEEWIVREQLDGLRGALTLLLMGDGLYADAVFRGQTLMSLQDEGLRMPPDPIDPGNVPPSATVIRELRGGNLEVQVPIILTGYPDTPLGWLRLGYSGEFANAQVHAVLSRTSGLAAAAWAGWMGVAALTLAWWGRREQALADEDPCLRYGALAIDPRTCQVRLGDQEVALTPKLYEILLLLAQREGELVSDQELLDTVWSDSLYAASPDVKQHIYLLRRALAEIHPDPKQVVVNVKGFGYRLDPPSTEDLRID
jgi:DNA-binding winged helix-turn-helix (wHTH) protein